MEELPAGTVVSLGRNQLLFRLHPGLYSCPHCHVDLATRKPDLSCSNFAWIDSSFALMTSCSACWGSFKLVFVEDRLQVTASVPSVMDPIHEDATHVSPAHIAASQSP